MKTTGQILQESRLLQKIDVAEVSRITKIRPESIRLLEADDYRGLPGGTIARGFIKNYSRFLGLNPQHVLAAFRRDFLENEKGEIIPRGIVEPVNENTFWSPRTTIIALVTLIFTIFGVYLIYQYNILVGPPTLEVVQPPSDVVVTERNLEVKGQTDPEAVISVNGSLVALEKGGRFSFRVPLIDGQNSLVIIATGKSGKTISITRSVTLTNTP
jgi:cytoskeletal protein RodZ